MSIKELINFSKNMGGRYLTFRMMHEFKRKTGILKTSFPVNPPFKKYISLNEWKNQDVKFFFQSRNDLQMAKVRSAKLKAKMQNILNGKINFFNSIDYSLGNNYDWVTNPTTGFVYDIKNTGLK